MIWNTFVPGLYQIIKFGFAIVVARILSPDDFGIMSIASIIIFYTNSISNFGFSTAIIQKENITKDHINSVFTINLIISLFLLLFFFLTAGQFSIFFKMDELKNVFYVLSSIFIITSFSLIPECILKRNLNFKLLSKIQLINAFSSSCITLILAVLGFKYWSFVYGLIACQLISTPLIIYYSKWIPRIAFNKNAIKEILSFSSWSFVNSQIRMTNDYIDKLIVGKFLGASLLGYYEKGFALAFTPIESISYRITGVMFSAFSRSQDDPESLRWYLQKSLIASSILCFPIFLGFFLVAPHFTVVLLGEKWIPMIGSLQILLIAFMISTITNIFDVLNISAGEFKKQIKGRMVFSFLLIGLCLLSVKNGINAVAFGILAYHTAFFFFTFGLAKKRLRLSWSFLINVILPAATYSGLMFVSVKLLSVYFFSDENLSGLLCLSFFGAMIYGISFFAINFSQTVFIKDELFNVFKKFYVSLSFFKR